MCATWHPVTPSLTLPIGSIRKTSKKGNRVYVRRPVSTEMLRAMVADALSQLKPEVKEIVVKVADRPAVKMDGKVHEKFAEILDLAAQRMEILMVGPAGCGKSHLAEQIAKALGLRFGSISCSAGMSEGQITGPPDSDRGRRTVRISAVAVRGVLRRGRGVPAGRNRRR